MNKGAAKKQKPLTKKERLFCELFSGGFTAREAAAEAGFSPPRLAGHRMLLRRDITSVIRSAKKQKNAYPTAAEGLRRIAFGPITDAVRLAVGDPEARGSLETLDLFGISEIKVKEGATEIKFFDRIKALEALCELEGDAASDSSGILEAIIKSAGNRRRDGEADG